MEIVHSTTVTPPSGTHTSPSPAHLSANRITLPFCSCLLIGRNWNVKHPPSGQSNAGRTNRTLILQDCFDHVDWDMFQGSVWWRHRGVFRYGHVFHQEVYRWCSSDQNNPIYPNQKPWINSDVRSALSARTSAYKSGNTAIGTSQLRSQRSSNQSSPTEHIKQSWRTFQQQ